jgi:hypothetical protein
MTGSRFTGSWFQVGSARLRDNLLGT